MTLGSIEDCRGSQVRIYTPFTVTIACSCSTSHQVCWPCPAADRCYKTASRSQRAGPVSECTGGPSAGSRYFGPDRHGGTDADAQRHLSQQFADRSVEKRYLAIVFGTPARRAGHDRSADAQRLRSPAPPLHRRGLWPTGRNSLADSRTARRSDSAGGASRDGTLAPDPAAPGHDRPSSLGRQFVCSPCRPGDGPAVAVARRGVVTRESRRRPPDHLDRRVPVLGFDFPAVT